MKRNWFIKFNEWYDEIQKTKNLRWISSAFYISMIAVIYLAHESILPTFWLCVVFFSVIGFWFVLALLRQIWMFYAHRYYANLPFE